MSTSAPELDFFPIDKHSSATPQKLFDRPRSFRDIQSVISKINPELLKTVIASGSVDKSSTGKSFGNGNFLPSNKSFSVPSTPKEDQYPFPALPLYTPTFRPSSSSETAPLTIFYNGAVSVFNLPQRKAENILKLAHEVNSKAIESKDSKPADEGQLLETLNRDLPIARRKSLQRFLEKRKERLTLVSPTGPK